MSHDHEDHQTAVHQANTTGQGPNSRPHDDVLERQPDDRSGRRRHDDGDREAPPSGSVICLRPWRDVESLDLGDNTTDEIENILDECAVAILWINHGILASDYVARVELPAISRAWSRNGLRIVPVFDGMTPEEASTRMRDFGLEVQDSNGHVVDNEQSDEATARDIAARCARATINRAHAFGTPPSVRLVTYDDTADLRDDAVVNLDWRHHTADDTLTTVAEQRLRSALHTTSRAVKEAYGASDITLAVKAHLPLATALGHAFAEPTGCTLQMLRDEQTWHTTRRPAEVPPLTHLRSPRGPVDADAAALEISISRDVEVGVDAYAQNRRYRHRAKLLPATGPDRDAVDGPVTANAWARQIGDSITDLCDARYVEHVDVFLATPVELAVMTGWWANAAGNVNLMNWTGKTGPYARMWTLP